MKHHIELDVTSYSLDVTNVIISDCVQKVTAINAIEEYLGKLANSEGELGQVPPVKHSNGQPTWEEG